jgi:outer membrane receptor protein involved in Fe transport
LARLIALLAVSVGLLLSGSSLAQERVTIGVLEIVGKAGVSQDRADVLVDLLADEIGRLGDVEVVDQFDINTMLQVDRRNQLSGCTDNSCISEIMGALGVRFVVTGNISQFGDIYLLNLKLLDAASALVLGRVSKRVRGGEEKLLDEFPDAARELFDRVAARIGLHLPYRVTAAARHAQQITESPSAVIVITRKDIEESGAGTFEDLLRYHPASHVYVYDPLFPFAAIRGDIRVLLTLDGREQNIEFFEAPFLATLPVGIQEIERVEIVLGPNSALYGANAVAAVIDVRTRQPATGFNAEAYLTAGQRNNTIVGGRLGGGTGNWAAQAAFSKDQADSWMQRDSTVRDLTRASGTFRWDFAEGGLTVDGGILTGAGRTYSDIGFLDWSSFLFSQTNLSVEWGRLRARAYWYGTRGTFDADLGLRQPETGLLLATLPTISVAGDTFEFQAQYDLEPFENNLLLVGADFRYFDYDVTNMVNPEMNETRLGMFVHDEHQFGDSLLITLGARLDWNSKTDLAVSPRAAIVYRPAQEHHLRLSGGTAFRKPSIMESSLNPKVNAEPAFEEIETLLETRGLSNPDLENEILTSVELGYRAGFLDKVLRLGLDLYLNLYRKRIGFVSDVRFLPPWYVQIDLENSRIGYENRGLDQNTVGVNLNIEAEPVEWLSLFMRGEYQYAYYTDDQRSVEYIPRLIGMLGGVVRVPAGLTVHLTLVRVSERSADLRDPVSILAPNVMLRIPARLYILANINYRMNLGDSRIDLGLNLFNPFGARFREAAGLLLPDRTNHGAEELGSRMMFTARLAY